MCRTGSVLCFGYVHECSAVEVLEGFGMCCTYWVTCVEQHVMVCKHRSMSYMAAHCIFWFADFHHKFTAKEWRSVC